MSGSSTLLPALVVTHRLTTLRQALAERGLDGMLVTKAVNVRWLSGFTGSNGQLAVTADGFVLVTDGRYRQQAADELSAAGCSASVEVTATAVGAVLTAVFATGTSVGFEAADMSVTAHHRLEADLAGRRLVATESLIETLRQIKDEAEMERLRRASAIADASFQAVQPLLHQRPTERRLAAEVDHQMRLRGAEDVSFSTIVGSGPNSALPHARPTDRVIEPGDLVVIDFGAKIDGYGSDMTRTVVAGSEPTADQQRLYEAVLEAQQAGVAAVAAGVSERLIDTTCRDVLARHDLGEAFVHGTGHGIGLEIHEQPILSGRSVGILRSGLVVTVEPGAYLPGFGGVRVEDSVIVTEQGCLPITKSPKGLVPEFDRAPG